MLTFPQLLADCVFNVMATVYYRVGGGDKMLNLKPWKPHNIENGGLSAKPRHDMKQSTNERWKI